MGCSEFEICLKSFVFFASAMLNYGDNVLLLNIGCLLLSLCALRMRPHKRDSSDSLRLKGTRTLGAMSPAIKLKLNHMPQQA